MEKIELKPASVFHYFEEICKVPRPSKKEEKIIAYLMKFAEEQGLEAKKDEAGNILMKNHGLQVFLAWSGRFLHQDITRVVLFLHSCCPGSPSNEAPALKSLSQALQLGEASDDFFSTWQAL